MNKFKLMAVIAVAGALGLSARASSITNVDLVTIKATVTLQAETVETASSAKFVVTKVKIVTKDVLGLIDDEFGSTFANTNGTQLAVESFDDAEGDFGGSVEVLDKNGNVLNGDAGEDTGDYQLGIEFDNAVATGSETESKGTLDYTAVSDFFFKNVDDTTSFEVDGAASVKQSFLFDEESKNSESFELSGSGDVQINGNSGVITEVSVKGSGKNNENVSELSDLLL